MNSNIVEEEDAPAVSMRDQVLLALQRKFNYYRDKTVPHVHARWISLGVLLLLYMIRVYLVGGFYIITYALGIYLLQRFIGFLSPKHDPDDGVSLPTTAKEGMHVFVRKVPEFQFWFDGTKWTVASLFATFFRFLDIPVYAPILVIYFFVLFFMTMRSQIMHMWKHKYVPWSWGKTKYSATAGGNDKKGASD